MYSFCIFDFDYTLGDSTDGIVQSVNFALNSMGYKSAAKDDIRKTIGMALNDTFSYLTGISDETEKARFSSLFIKKADEVITESTVLFPDCIETLSKLKEKGVTTFPTTRQHDDERKFPCPGTVSARRSLVARGWQRWTTGGVRSVTVDTSRRRCAEWAPGRG
jgi:phosphoglycolate phosphatase-like HAD superfamily hydrolase